MCVARPLTLSAVGIACLKKSPGKGFKQGGIVLAFQIFLRIISVWVDMALELVVGRE
jgi:hypothetical protein